MKRPKGNRRSAAEYETRDVAPRKVIYTGIGLFAGTAVSIGFVMGLLALLSAPGIPTKPALEALSQEPTAPRLEVDGRANSAALETAAAEKLTGYAWIDRSSGTVRIPIERAMELLAAHGWPEAEGASAP
jgi:hypothetical protein